MEEARGFVYINMSDIVIYIISLHAVASQPIGHNSRFKVPHMVYYGFTFPFGNTHVHTHTHQRIHCKVFKMRMHCGPPDRYVSRITDMDMRSTSAAAAAPLSPSPSLPPSLPPSLAPSLPPSLPPCDRGPTLNAGWRFFFWGFARQVPCSRRTPLIEWSALTRRHWGLLDRGAIWSISKRKTRTAPDRNAWRWC